MDRQQIRCHQQDAGKKGRRQPFGLSPNKKLANHNAQKKSSASNEPPGIE